MQLVYVAFGLFAFSDPKHGPAELVHFLHVMGSLRFIVTENLSKHHHDVAHEIYGIVQHEHFPWSKQLDLFFGIDLREGFSLWK